jgi:hypothetical protein
MSKSESLVPDVTNRSEIAVRQDSIRNDGEKQQDLTQDEDMDNDAPNSRREQS